MTAPGAITRWSSRWPIPPSRCTWSTAAATGPRTSTPTSTSTRPPPCAAGAASARSPSRGDSKFSQTTHLDRWDTDGIRFIFGIDAMPNLVALAEGLAAEDFSELERPARYTIKTAPRQARERHKDRVVSERQFKTLKLTGEEVAEFDYRPVACKKAYRMIVLRKNLVAEKGQLWLFGAGSVLLLHHQRPDDPGVGDRIPGQRPVRSGEPDRATQGRREGIGDAGGQLGEQRGVHGDGGPGVEPEGVGGVVAARGGPVGREDTGPRSGPCCGWSSARSAWR